MKTILIILFGISLQCLAKPKQDIALTSILKKKNGPYYLVHYFSYYRLSKKMKVSVLPLVKGAKVKTGSILEIKELKDAENKKYYSHKVEIKAADWNKIKRSTMRRKQTPFYGLIHYPVNSKLEFKNLIRPTDIPMKEGLSLANLKGLVEADGEPYLAFFQTCKKGRITADGFECEYFEAKNFEFTNDKKWKILKTKF